MHLLVFLWGFFFFDHWTSSPKVDPFFWRGPLKRSKHSWSPVWRCPFKVGLNAKPGNKLTCPWGTGQFKDHFLGTLTGYGCQNRGNGISGPFAWGNAASQMLGPFFSRVMEFGTPKCKQTSSAAKQGITRSARWEMLAHSPTCEKTSNFLEPLLPKGSGHKTKTRQTGCLEHVSLRYVPKKACAFGCLLTSKTRRRLGDGPRDVLVPPGEPAVLDGVVLSLTRERGLKGSKVLTTREKDNKIQGNDVFRRF